MPFSLETVFAFIRTIASDGVTLLIAEQSERWLSGLADRVYYLEVGRVVQAPTQPLTAGVLSD